MSSSQVYAAMADTTTAQQMGGDVAAGAVTRVDWFTPNSYTYNDAYVTPYPSSTMDNQQWASSYARASMSDVSVAGYPFPLHANPHQQQMLPDFKEPGRPRSSPSTFGPSADNIAWPATTGLGIQYSTAAGQPTPVSSSFPPHAFHGYPVDEQYITSSPPEIRQPQPRRPYPTIAPNPAGVAVAKRKRDDDDRAESSSSAKRARKRTSSVASADLSGDERFLVQLKEDENLPWKDIVNRFHTDKGKNFNIAALQMRYKRLREKFRVWEEQDLRALKLAHEYWEKSKWEIISLKMLDHGLTEKWPARYCQRKWQDLESAVSSRATAAGLTPSMSQYSSPVEGQFHYAFMPV